MTTDEAETNEVETPEDLVEKWRDEASGSVSWNDYGDGIHEAMLACAAELEEVLENDE